jgi:hypothetical protein
LVQIEPGQIGDVQVDCGVAAEEVKTARRILAIGNGGIFIFPIDYIPRVEAIDLFVTNLSQSDTRKFTGENERSRSG